MFYEHGSATVNARVLGTSHVVTSAAIMSATDQQTLLVSRVVSSEILNFRKIYNPTC